MTWHDTLFEFFLLSSDSWGVIRLELIGASERYLWHDKWLLVGAELTLVDRLSEIKGLWKHLTFIVLEINSVILWSLILYILILLHQCSYLNGFDWVSDTLGTWRSKFTNGGYILWYSLVTLSIFNEDSDMASQFLVFTRGLFHHVCHIWYFFFQNLIFLDNFIPWLFDWSYSIFIQNIIIVEVNGAGADKPI